MRNPTQALDASLLKEEPLRSFFRDVGLQYRPEDAIFQEKRRSLINELIKERNVEAVKTWVGLAFPADQAPLGKTAPQGHTAVDIFANFFWLFYLDVQHKRKAKTYIGQERAKLGWPTTFSQTLERFGNHATKNEITKLDKHDGMHNLRKPINPSTSHVMIKRHEVPLSERNSGLKSENTTASLIDPRQHHNPHLNPTHTNSENSRPSSSSTIMRAAITTGDNGSLSPLTEYEYESEVSTTCAIAQTRLEKKGRQRVPAKRRHYSATGSQVETTISRSVSDRFRGNQSGHAQPSATTDIKGHTILNPRTAFQEGSSKVNPRSNNSLPITRSRAPLTSNSISVKRELLDGGISDLTVYPTSSHKQGHSNATLRPPPPKIRPSSQLPQSISASSRKQSSQKKKVSRDSLQGSISALNPKSTFVRPGAIPEGEIKHDIKAKIGQREKLRPKMPVSSGSPKHSIASKAKGISEPPAPSLKRKRTETLDANKNAPLSKSITTEFGKKKKVTTQNVRALPPRPSAGKLELPPKANSSLKHEDLGQDLIVPSSVNVISASKMSQRPPSKLKRKRSGNFEIDSSSVTKGPSTFQIKKEHSSLLEQPASKKSRKGTSSSEKGSRPLDNNRRQPRRLRKGHKGSIIPPPSENKLKLGREVIPNVAIETIPSPVLIHLEKQPLGPTGEQLATDVDIRSSVLPTSNLTISCANDNISYTPLENTGRTKEEAFETSQIPVFQSSPILASHFQEDEEEIEPALYDDLLPSEEFDNQFMFPEDHPANFCQLPKPPLRILPPIWAESRQELCETFDWFRSYQGGVYHAHNVTKGYLLSGFPASRDRFEHRGRLIISHGGGKAESIHSHRGRLESQPASDQLAQDKSVRALYDNYLNNRPLALVMDDRYALFPYDMRAKNVTYAVLGFYTIAEAWAEYQPSNNQSGRVIRYKFAFRWCDDQGPPWWEQQEEIHSESDDQMNAETTVAQTQRSLIPASSPGAACDDILKQDGSVGLERDQQTLSSQVLKIRECHEQKCSSCSRIFSQVFSLSWTCLNPECHKFWRRDDGRLLPDSLNYNTNFLELGPSKPIPLGFGNLEPTSALFFPLDNITTYAFTRGFHCYNCGRLSCRYQWEKWECMNAACQASLKISCPPRAAATLLYQNPVTTFKDYSLNPISDIIQLPPASFKHDKGRGLVQTFVLPHECAKIHHIQSGNFLGRQEADSIFLDYQNQATSGELRFRRWHMRAHKCRGALLTNYFSQNSGEPYKYVGGDTNTVPFESAPGAVVRARELIQRRVMQSLQIPAHFNEVLSAAYMERQKMAFHSDDEVGLGPLVAGLSLGSPALMHFRLHGKHDIDREKRGILLSIVLRHGDVLVMDGAAVQEYYEHTVVPTNFRIAATARQIGANHA